MLRYVRLFALLLSLLIPATAKSEIPLQATRLLEYVQHRSSILDEIKVLDPYERNQVLCMALNLYHEARGEDTRHQWAVLHVVANRAKHSKYPSSFCEVVWERGQFTWTRRALEVNLPRERNAWKESQNKAYKLFTGESRTDPTNGATHFYQSHLRPAWASRLVNRVQIGVHTFARIPERVINISKN